MHPNIHAPGAYELAPDPDAAAIAERLAANVAAHLRDPALVRGLIEGHIIGYSLGCRGVDANGQVHCHETLEEEAPA
jgi:hypothetical protein